LPALNACQARESQPPLSEQSKAGLVIVRQSFGYSRQVIGFAKKHPSNMVAIYLFAYGGGVGNRRADNE
jgi:hypothetical protein